MPERVFAIDPTIFKSSLVCPFFSGFKLYPSMLIKNNSLHNAIVENFHQIHKYASWLNNSGNCCFLPGQDYE